MEPSSPAPTPTTRRRALMKGAAWAAPTVAASYAAPAYAASPAPQPPGLNGWVTIRATCPSSTRETVEINGQGTYPDKGLWATPATSTQMPTDAKITYRIPSSVGTLSWSAATGNSGWTVPTSTGTSGGVTSYLTTYSGTWTYNATDKLWTANGQPHFLGTGTTTGGCQSFSMTAVRSVKISGTLHEFTRSVTITPS